MGDEAGQHTASSDAFETAWVLPHVSAAHPGLCADCTLLELPPSWKCTHLLSVAWATPWWGAAPPHPSHWSMACTYTTEAAHQQPPISPGVVNAAQ